MPNRDGSVQGTDHEDFAVGTSWIVIALLEPAIRLGVSAEKRTARGSQGVIPNVLISKSIRALRCVVNVALRPIAAELDFLLRNLRIDRLMMMM